MRAVVRDAMHMFCTPRTFDFYRLTSTQQHAVEEYISRRVKGDWDLALVEEQFMCPILMDWKYNTAREARNYLDKKRPQGYRPAHMKEADWTWILQYEAHRKARNVEVTHQQRIASASWKASRAPPNCLGAGGRTRFKNFFMRKFGRLPTWEEMEYCRLTKGKPMGKLADYWAMNNIEPPAQLRPDQKMEAFFVYKDLIESGCRKAEVLGIVVRGLNSGALIDNDGFLEFLAQEYGSRCTWH